MPKNDTRAFYSFNIARNIFFVPVKASTKRVQNFCGSARYYFSNSRAPVKTYFSAIRAESRGEQKISDHSRYAAFIEYINFGNGGGGEKSFYDDATALSLAATVLQANKCGPCIIHAARC